MNTKNWTTYVDRLSNPAAAGATSTAAGGASSLSTTTNRTAESHNAQSSTTTTTALNVDIKTETPDDDVVSRRLPLEQKPIQV